MTPTSVGLVLVEGRGADGATMDRNAFDVRHGAVKTSEQAAEAVRHTEAFAATHGLRLQSIGVTWSEDSDAEAALLMRSLSESGFDNVVPVRMPEATEALARGMASVIGYQTTAVCVIEPETAMTLIVHGGDGAVQTAFNHAVHTESDLINWLSTVFERADFQPEALVVVGSAGGFASMLPALELALSVPAFAPDEAELALARGAALASAQSIEGPLDLDDGFTAFGAVGDQDRSRPTGARRLAAVGPAAMLVAGAVTFVVSVSLAVSLQLTPRTDSGPSESVNAASERQARVTAPDAPASVRPKPPAAIAPAPAAPPPLPEAPALPESAPANVAPPEAAYPPEGPVVDQVPAAAPEYQPVDVPPAPPALAPPAIAQAPTMPPPVAAPYPTKKPGILTRIRDKLRIGDDNPPPPPVPPVITVFPGG